MLHIITNGHPVGFRHEINAFFIDFSVLKKGVNGHSQHHTKAEEAHSRPHWREAISGRFFTQRYSGLTDMPCSIFKYQG